jgi:hypothetical protein
MKSVVTTMALLAIVQASTNKTETLKTTIAPAKAAPASARNFTATPSAAKTAATVPFSPVTTEEVPYKKGYEEIVNEMSEEMKGKFFKFDHGFPFLAYWGIASVVALAVKRYLKYGRSTALVLHIIFGSIITIMTGIIGYESMELIHWTLPSDFNIHAYFAMAVTIMVISLPISGFASIIVGQCYTPKPWSHHKEIQTKMGQAHRWLGYVIIFLGVLANSTGLHEYQRIYARDAATKTYIFLNVLAAGGQLFICELVYQLYNRYSKAELPLDKGTEAWSV